MQATIVQLPMFSLGAVGFTASLIGLIAFLSIMRRVRTTRMVSPVPVAQTPSPAQRARTALTAEVAKSLAARQSDLAAEPPPRPTTIPEEWLLPTREGKPDQVVIMIEPDDEPTRQERAVKRLIAHLQTDGVRAG